MNALLSPRKSVSASVFVHPAQHLDDDFASKATDIIRFTSCPPGIIFSTLNKQNIDRLRLLLLPKGSTFQLPACAIEKRTLFCKYYDSGSAGTTGNCETNKAGFVTSKNTGGCCAFRIYYDQFS